MNSFLIKSTIVLALAVLPIFAQEDTKQGLKANGVLVDFTRQKTVSSFSDMFKEGEFYGRLRSNNFFFHWANEDISHQNNLVGSVGASMVYQSAVYKDFDMKLGLYTSRAFFNNEDPIDAFKPAKDTLSRYNYVRTGSKSMAVVGQANLRYSGIDKTQIILGRQLVETFYTKSNDTKMVPNTFDGLVASTNALEETYLQFAYLAKQKLRDHTTSHSVLMYDNSDSANTSKWNANDDSAMHKGLTYTALKAAGVSTDAPLIIIEAKNKSIPKLNLAFSSYVVPELLSQAMGEVNYKIDVDGFSITPGVRFIQQFDIGAGEIGGAALSGNTTGYKNKNSLTSSMIAARIVAKIKDFKLKLGYSNIFGEADLVTPWRGFPTAGYTRSMGVYNWYSQTKSYRLELVKGANKKGIYKDIFIQTSILYTDGDEAKSIGKDYLYYYAGFIQNLEVLPELQWRLRLGYAQFLNDGDDKFNYLDSRFELNYLF